MNAAIAYPAGANLNTPPAANLANLIALIAEGDQQALSNFYDQTHRLVFSLALRVLNDRGAAEEVTLDVFMQVWKQARSFDPERGKPVTWLMTIARSRSIDRLRASSWRQQEQTPLEDVIPFIPDYNTPAEAAEISNRRQHVRAALAQLPLEQRELIEIAYYGGLTQQEISAHLKLPLGTVKTRMRSGLIRLRELLAPLH